MTNTSQTGRIQALNNQHRLHPFMVHSELRAQGPRVITRGESVYLWDSEGRKILDGMSGLWCVQLGYGVRELVDAAYEALSTCRTATPFFRRPRPLWPSWRT